MSARIRTLLDTQKRLTADLAAARKLQQQEQQHSQGPQQADSASGGPQPASFSSSTDLSRNVYVTRLAELLESTAPVVDHMQQELEDLITKFRWTAEYYCEDVEKQAWKQQPVAFLTHFLDLLDSLVATQKDKGRVARVTTILAEYVEMERARSEQREHELQQLVLEQMRQQQQQSCLQEEQDADQQQEEQDPMLLLQQQLLRQHAANSSASLDYEAASILFIPTANPNSPNSSSKPVADVSVGQLRSPPVVPRLALGAATTHASTAADRNACNDCPAEVSWGSDSVTSSHASLSDSAVSAEADAIPQDVNADVQSRPVSHCSSQPTVDDAAVDPAAMLDDMLLNSHTDNLFKFAVTGSPDAHMGSQAGRQHGVGSFSSEVTGLGLNVASIATDIPHLSQLAAAAAAVAAQQVLQHGEIVEVVSRSSDSSEVCSPPSACERKQHFMQHTASSSNRCNSIAQQHNAGNNRQPSLKQRQNMAQQQQQQQLSVSAGRSGPAAAQRAAALSGRKWNAADAELAAAAAAAANALQLGRACSVSPAKPKPHQQRLESLRLPGRNSSTLQQQPQQPGPHCSSAGDNGRAGRDALAQLLSSTDSD